MSGARKRTVTPSRAAASSRPTKQRAVSEKDAVEVICRLKPCTGEDGPSVVAVDEQHIRLLSPALARSGQQSAEQTYRFDYVFDESENQRAVFDRCGWDMVGDLMQGKSGLLFTYGVTGSGKTFTMTGKPRNQQDGVLPRSLDILFNSLPNLAERFSFVSDGRGGYVVQSEADAHAQCIDFERIVRPKIGMKDRDRETRIVKGGNDDYAYSVFVSYVEIYNNYCFDLLDPTLQLERGERTKAPQSKDLRHDTVNNVIYVENLTEVEVCSVDEAIEQFALGQERRRMAQTLLNQESSRAHSVFTIRLVMAPIDDFGLHPVRDRDQLRTSQLSLVDLAGSERAKRTENYGDRLTESGKINQSLMTLRQCFESLRHNQRQPNNTRSVPYRESKLTHLFKNFFEGSGRVRMIICINPRAADYEENIFVMTFAEVCQDVQVVRAADVLIPQCDGPVSRRMIMRWQREMDEVMAGVHQADYTSKSLFGSPPPFELNGPADGESIARLRAHYLAVARKRQGIMETHQSKMSEFDDLLRSFACVSDSHSHLFEQMENERAETGAEYRRIFAQNQQYKHELTAMRLRIRKYEAEEHSKFDEDEIRRRRERELAEDLRQKSMKLQQVRSIFETNSGTVGGGVTTVGSKQLGPCNSVNRQPGTVQSSSSSTVTTSKTTTVRFPPQVPPKPLRPVGQLPPYVNPRHRRSRSMGAVVIDHQPLHRVPEGQLLRMQKSKMFKTTTRVEANELSKADEYLLTHQEQDEEGNFRSNVFKGDVIPTAGGGSAVIYKDVETVKHSTPTTPKRGRVD